MAHPNRASLALSCTRLVALAFAVGATGCGADEASPRVAYPEAAPQTWVAAYSPTNAIVPLGASASVAQAAPPPILADGDYVLRNASSRECLDVPRQSIDSQTLLWQWECNRTLAQTWSFKRSSGSAYVVKSAVSGKCLDVPQKDQGTNVTLWQFDCNGSAAQEWKLEAASGGGFTLRSRATSQCLDVPHGHAVRGLGVQQYPCNGSAPQRWLIEPAEVTP